MKAGSLKNIWMKIRDAVYSENGMKVVNALFFLSLLSRSPLTLIAYIAWIVYLLFCLKRTGSKAARTIFSVFIGVAVAMIFLNLFFSLRGR